MRLPVILALFALLPCMACVTSAPRSGARAPSSVETPVCTPACAGSQVCMNQFSGFGQVAQAVCAPIPAEAPIDFGFPYDAEILREPPLDPAASSAILPSQGQAWRPSLI